MRRILHWIMIFISCCILNSASIVFVVLYNTGLYTKTEGRRTITYSNWTDLSTGVQMCVVLFMVIGVILTIMLIKWVFKDVLERSREKDKERRALKQKKKEDKFDKMIKEL